MAWLDDNPPRTQQFRCPRRENPSGVVGVHTAESFPDEVGPDDGAENVADFIRRRTSYGSYHDLCDSDSIVNLVRYGCVAYHIAPHGLNEHSYGVSAATQAHKWASLDPQWVDATVRNMARASARYARWLQQHYGITIPARRLTLAHARRKEPGFIAHGDADPGRRTDPGDEFPWGRFLDYYRDEMDGDDMPLSDEDKDFIRETARTQAEAAYAYGQLVPSPGGDQTWTAKHADGWTMRAVDGHGDMLTQILANQQAIMQSQGVEVDETALAASLAPLLIPALVEEFGDGVGDEVEERIERVLARVRLTTDAD